MNTETALPVFKSVIKQFLRIKNSYSSGGNTLRSRYCYSVWLRHLQYYNTKNNGVPEVIAELGPGDSLGIGLAALLSGCKQLHTLDVVEYWNTSRNLKKFNELVTLFKTQIDIPGNDEFPNIKPSLSHYTFPSHILTPDILKTSLKEERLEAIRSEILDLKNPNNTFIKCHVPWKSAEIIKNSTLDFIYSQSVLQYIKDLDFTFNTMRNWLKPKGIMSHSIDLSSIGITKNWNSHWTFSNIEWDILKSGKDFIINRLPYSSYIHKHHKYGFNIIQCLWTEKENALKNHQLSSRFKHLTEKDLKTSDVYILSQKE